MSYSNWKAFWQAVRSALARVGHFAHRVLKVLIWVTHYIVPIVHLVHWLHENREWMV